jgi:hypothetical protein
VIGLHHVDGGVNDTLEDVTGGVRGRKASHDPVQGVELFDLPQQLAVERLQTLLALDLLLQQKVFHEHGPLAQRPLEAQLHLFEIDGFDQEIHDAVFQRADGVFQRRVTRHHDDGQRVVRQVDAFGELEPVHLGHVEVGETAINLILPENQEGLSAVSRREDPIAPAAKILADDVQDAFLVVDDQKRFAFRCVHIANGIGHPQRKL